MTFPSGASFRPTHERVNTTSPECCCKRDVVQTLLNLFQKSDTIEFLTFQEGAMACSLLDSDIYLENALTEATTYQMPHSLRRLFATIVVYCSSAEPMILWEKFKCHLTEDLINYESSSLGEDARDLQLINGFFVGLDHSLNDFNILPDDLSHVLRDNTTSDIQTLNHRAT